MSGESCKAHTSVVTPWTVRSAVVISVRVRWWCRNSTVSKTWTDFVALATMVWKR